MALNPVITQQSLPLGIYPVTLYTLTAIKTYNRTCERMDHSLYLAMIAVRVRGEVSRRFETEIAQVENMLLGHLDKLKRQIFDQRRYLHKLLSKSGLEPDLEAIPYSQPATFTIRVKTPRAGQYVQLLQELDTLTRLVDLAWYHGIIDTAQQLLLTQTMHRWFITQTNSIANLARGLARRVSERADGVNATYAAMLKKRIGVAPTDESPLDKESHIMTASEQAELADTIALSTVLEQVKDTEPATAGEVEDEPKRRDETEAPAEVVDHTRVEQANDAEDAALQDPIERPRGKLAQLLGGQQK